MKPFDDDQAFFVDITVECVLWGVYTCIFLSYLRLEKRDRSNVLRYPLCFLWFLCTTYFAIDAASSYLWIFGDNAHDAHVYGTFNIVSSVLFAVIDFVSQSILIYRCWVMWSKKWYIVALPLLASFTALVGNMTLIISLATRGRSQSSQPAWFFQLGTAVFAISLATNALVTFTLVARLWMIYMEIRRLLYVDGHSPEGRSNGGGGGRKAVGHVNVWPVMTLLVESGMMMFVGQLVWLVLFAIQNLGFNAVAGPVAQIAGLTPTMVIVRVAAGSSYESHKTRMETSIRFGHSGVGAEDSHGTAVTVRVARDEDHDLDYYNGTGHGHGRRTEKLESREKISETDLEFA